MEYFKTGLKTVLGAPQPGQQPSGAETVERLIERVKTSTLLDDRRDACRAIKSLSRTFRLEVGAQCMDPLIRVLETDRMDAEIVGYALEALANVIAGNFADEDYIAVDEVIVRDDNMGAQFAEIYIKRPENVTLLLELLEEYDFKVRRPALKLLTRLLQHRLKDVQECILVSPMGVSKLMDLLSDSREVIRNDAILLLVHLTKSNANIQKIVAFEEAFDRLLNIIAEEGYSDGGVVVEDCLCVLLSLLKNNISNQNFFKEGSYIQRLVPFFDIQTNVAAGDWGFLQQKINNIQQMLLVIRTLVSPTNPQQSISSCQKVMFQCGLLEKLSIFLMASGVSADILSETVSAAGDVIRGHYPNQEFFSGLQAPSSPPRPVLVVLLMSMLNDKQPFSLRCAVLYCFQCFLHKNDLGQAQIIQTLLPTSANGTDTISTGQLLCGGLFSTDPLSQWFAAVALSRALIDNPSQKDQLLRVQLATGVGNPPSSLLVQITTILKQGGKVQTRLGLLMLLCMWLANSKNAVNLFLKIDTNIPYLSSQVSLAEVDDHEDLVQGVCAFLLGICIEFNDDSTRHKREDLKQLIYNRINLETYLNKLGAISKSEAYSQAAQKPQIKWRYSNDVLFDYEFCRLFKSLEGNIIKAVQPQPRDMANGFESNLNADQNVLQQYKDLIREQDEKLKTLEEEYSTLKNSHEQAQEELKDVTGTIQQLKDQNALLKASRAANSTEKSGSPSIELCQLKQELEGLQKKNAELESQLKEKDDVITEMSKIEVPVKTEDAVVTSSPEDLHTIETLRLEVEDLKNQLDKKTAEFNDASKQWEASKEETMEMNNKLKVSNEQWEEKYNTLNSEQEDLLVLLTDQGTTIQKYKEQIVQLGGKVEDDDDEEDDEEEDEDDEGLKVQ